MLLIAPLLTFALAAPPDPEVPTYKLTVHPAAVPVPALRYRLLPELRDRHEGNALVLYYKAFSPEWMGSIRQEKTQDALQAALEMPLDKLRGDPGGVRFVQNLKLLETVDEAARRSYIDWELLPGVRKDGIGLLLPDTQSMRTFAVLLAVRARLDIADGRFDRAVRGLGTGFQMARHLCEAPTLIHALIGTAIASMMIQQLDTLVQQPGAPNLYWALADLPRPFINLHTGMQGEKLFLDWLAPGVREKVADPDAPPMSPDQLREIADRLASVSGQWGKPVSPEARLGIAVFAAQRYPEAREWLVANGWSEARIDALPVTQAALMYEVFDYDRQYDEGLKWFTQPPSVALAGLAAIEGKLVGRSRGVGVTLPGLLLPATVKVYESSLRVDRRIAALRCVEAVRLYASTHEGNLPATLNDVTEVPIPPDPATGKPFGYAVNGDTATLTAPPYSKRGSGNTFVYELTFGK